MLSLADRLAVTRTELANERTLLAYVRTALTLAAGGAALIQLFAGPLLVTLGWVLLPAALLVLLVGVHRFRRARRALAALGRPGEPADVLGRASPT